MRGASEQSARKACLLPRPAILEQRAALGRGEREIMRARRVAPSEIERLKRRAPPVPAHGLDPEILEFDPGADFERARSGWARSVPAWRGGRALRMYDRGDCSAAVSWRELGEQLAVGIDGALHGRGRPVGSWNLTYELVQPLFGDGDNFTFTRPYEVRVPDTELHIVVSFQITGQLTATDLQMGFRLIRGVVIIPPSVAGPGGEDPLSPEDAAMVEDGIEAGLVTALGQSLADSLTPRLLVCTPAASGDEDCFQRLGALVDIGVGAPPGTAQPHNLRCVAVNANEGECRFVPNVYRVNHRVDGVAVVLSETDTFTPRSADPFYRVLEAGGACHGFRIDPFEPIACVHDAIIEPPRRVDHALGSAATRCLPGDPVTCGRILGTIGAALALTACYQGHGPAMDGAVDGSLPDTGRLDAGGFEGGSADAGPNLPACMAPTECVCWVENVELGRHGRCITPFGDDDVSGCDVGGGCARSSWLCNDLGSGVLRGQSEGGVCVPPSGCAWLRSIDSRAVCFYDDGTPFDTGLIADDACAASDRGVVCGPGCGRCASGQTCVGASERSGLGLCASGSPPDSPSRCGADFPSCPAGQACLGFILPADVTTVRQEQVWSSCVGSAQCVSLTMRYPDRFRCLE